MTRVAYCILIGVLCLMVCSVVVFKQFMECFIIGRDLVRLLQNVARIPEMDLIWRDLMHNPQNLSPQFTGVCSVFW